MSLTTFSSFYYGHTVTTANNAIDFKEGGSELQATLNSGDYTLTEYLAEIKRAMDAAGALTYTVSVNRSTRRITISSTSNFSLLVATGTRIGTGAWGLMGFSGSDKTGASTYTGGSASGYEYRPQHLLIEHVASDNWVEKNDASVNRSASGKVQVILFGTTRYIRFNIVFSTDLTISQYQPEIETQASGMANLRSFMDYAITKAKFEYMADRDTPSTFQKVLLERTEEAKDGTEYRLKELKKGPGYFETGTLTLRVVT